MKTVTQDRRKYDRSAFGASTAGQRSGEDILQFVYKRAAFFGVALGVFYFTNLEATPVTNRRRMILFPSAWEATLGDIAVKQVVRMRLPMTCPDDASS